MAVKLRLILHKGQQNAVSELPYRDGMTVMELISSPEALGPAAIDGLGEVMILVNSRRADMDTVLSDGDRVTFLNVMAGG